MGGVSGIGRLGCEGSEYMFVYVHVCVHVCVFCGLKGGLPLSSSDPDS